jgi:hypothetical protein
MKLVKAMTATVTMKRPNGDIETVDASKFGNMSQTLADKISEASNKAGKGVVIAWTYTPAEYEQTEAEKAHDAEMADYEAHSAKMRKVMSY